MAEAWYLLRRNPLTLGGLVLIAIIVLVALLAPWIAPYDPVATNTSGILLSPNQHHPMGTDQFGEDILSRVLWAARIDLVIAVGAVATAVLIGGPLGALAGFARGWWDELIMRIMDVLQAFPSFILAMGVVAALGPSVPNLIISIALVNIAIYARLMRSRMLVVRQSLYASAAIGVGNPRWRVLAVHLVPNCLTPLLVQSSLQSGWAILSAAGLSYIGLGVRLPEAEWGVMVAMGASRIVSGEWWVSLYPGLCIAVAVTAFNIVGDGLHSLLDPGRR